MTKVLSLLVAAGLLAGSPAKTAKPVVTVSLTAVTMGDDCGKGVDTAPTPEPVQPAATPAAPAPKASNEDLGEAMDHSVAASRRAPRCQQSSMQLSVIAPAGADKTELRVKKVELFDRTGTLIGVLTPKSPNVWKKDVYKSWDQKIKAGESLSVSYALSQPSWGGVLDPYSQTYTLKVVVSLAGSDQSLEHEATVYSEASLPPGVVT